MSELESRLAAVETLAGHTDRDVAGLTSLLRAQTSLMQALRETQNSMNTVLANQGLALGEVLLTLIGSNERLGKIERRLSEHDQRFDRVDQRFDGIDQRFDRIDQRFDGVDQRFDGIDQRFDGIDQRFDRIDQKFDEVLRRLPPAK